MSNPNLLEQRSLAESFAQQNKSFTNRAAAIFPLYLRKNTDLRIVFLNYWKIKNHIAQVQYNLRVYNQAGQLIYRSTQRIEDWHNDFSIKAILGDVDFEGMAEVEFISLDNLRYSFPAIAGVYVADNCFSAVHSAGRIRNSDELGLDKYSIETNWTCKFGSDVTPYFHIFNGQHPNAMGDVEVTLHAPDQTVLRQVTLKNPIPNPFASKIVFADEIFDLKDTAFIPQDSYLSVCLSVRDVFPRMVVGNFFRRNNFMEFTHTFPVQITPDYVKPPQDQAPVKVLSYLSVFQPKELNSEAISFPTNCEADVEAQLWESDQSQTLKPAGRTIKWKTGGKGAKVFKYKPQPNVPITCLQFTEGNIPSRLNANYVFSVKGIDTRYTTDVASGFMSCVYPPKRSHWAQGVFGGDFDTILIFQNISHWKGQKKAEGELQVFTSGGKSYKTTLCIEPESCVFIRLSEFMPKQDFPKAQAISWFVQVSEITVDAIWVSFAPDGRIAGCHGF